MNVYEGSYYDQGTLSYRVMAMCLVLVKGQSGQLFVFSVEESFLTSSYHTKIKLMLSSKIFSSISCKCVYLDLHECVIVSQGEKLQQYSCFQ